MIGILQNKQLTDNVMSDIAQWHWNAVQTIIATSRVKSADGLNKKDLLNAIQPYSLEEIVKADYATLVKLKDAFPKSKIAHFIGKGKSGKHFMHTLYEAYRHKYGRELVEKLHLSVCPYCNRSYINNNANHATAQFDHFFPKSKYPILALSLYNLIPCCSSCNHEKREAEIGVSPYDKTQTTDNLLYFQHIRKDVNDVAITIKTWTDGIKSNIAAFQLESIYNYHTDLVNELLLKKQMYNSRKINAIKTLFENQKVPFDMSFKEFLYGNYLSEDKYYLRPLSKFTRDIIEDLKND